MPIRKLAYLATGFVKGIRIAEAIDKSGYSGADAIRALPCYHIHPRPLSKTKE